MKIVQAKTKSIGPFISGYPILTEVGYKERHDKIGHYIHWKICKCYEYLILKNDINTKQNQLLLVLFGIYIIFQNQI